jgi:hypothetical protein
VRTNIDWLEGNAMLQGEGIEGKSVGGSYQRQGLCEAIGPWEMLAEGGYPGRE